MPAQKALIHLRQHGVRAASGLLIGKVPSQTPGSSHPLPAASQPSRLLIDHRSLCDAIDSGGGFCLKAPGDIQFKVVNDVATRWKVFPILGHHRHGILPSDQLFHHRNDQMTGLAFVLDNYQQTLRDGKDRGHRAVGQDDTSCLAMRRMYHNLPGPCR